MRKIFLLISVLMLTLAVNAKEINISPNYPHSSGNNLLATLAAEGTKDGDVIILADGTYNESSNYIVFDKSVEVRAAEGAHPIVEVECEVRIGKNASGKNITIRGIKFDASKQDASGNNTNTYSHFIRIYSAGTLDFENCEFYSSTNKVIEVESTSSVDNLVINNCYFHNNSKSCIYIENTVASNLTITNSTFANSTTTSKGTIFSKAATSSIIRVDHCTFYNCTTENTDYGVIGHNGFLPTDVVVSNSVFAWGTEYDKRATYLPTGTSVTNCLTYNTNKDVDKWGHHSGPTFSNCAIQDPLFNDLANNKYTFDNNWVTMSISPAVGAATDGSDLGDPRWYTDPILPSTDFATPYVFVGAKAIVSDKMQLNGDNYIASTASGGSAYWKINITKVCAVQVTLNMSNAVVTGHNYQVEIFDAENNSIGALNEGGWHNNTDDKTLTGNIQIPSAGNYKIVLTNNESGTTSVIKGITLTYIGGAVQNIPCTMLPADALKSSRAFVNGDGEFRFTSDEENGHVTEEWAKWKMHADKDGYYKFTTSVNSSNGHSYLVTIYNADETIEKGSVAQSGDDIWGVPKTFSTGNILLEAGDYVLKIQNTTNNSYGRIVNVVATYEGGSVVNVPGELLGEDAVLEATKMYRESNGDIHYNYNGTPENEYAWWNIHAEAGEFIVTLNLDADNGSGHNYLVELYDGTTLKSSTQQGADDWHKGDIELTDHIVVPAAGNYTIRLTNQTANSSNIIHGITFTEVAAPTFVTIDETATDNTAWVGNVGGAAVNAELSRTFTGGMYNTICLPFAVSSDKVVAAFGAGVELMYMTGATLDGTVLDLEFAPTTSIYQGTPYLIKPAADVVNPQFTAVEFALSDASATGGTNADFIGTFVKTTIPSDPNNLYLQANNMLQFSQSEVTIKGMRAYFHVKVPSSSPVVRPRIVLNGQVLTDIELVNGEPQTNGKFIENGQLIIIRDGIRYNAIGIRVK